MSDKSWKLGIVGWPLGYSLSPLMHTAALKAAGLNGEYREYPVKPGELERWLETEAPKLDGFNVTMPHKETVAMWAAERGKRVSIFGQPGDHALMSVNTVKFKNGIPLGYNTDGLGFLAPIRQRLLHLRNQRVVLLGAGGSALTIAGTLRQEGGIERLFVWNRHPQKAHPVASIGKGEIVSDINEVPLRDCGVLVNATPAGMKDCEDLPLDFTQLHAGQVVYDIVYEPRETKLIREARSRGCTVITGDEMLAAQGAASFEIWTGVKAEKVLPAMKQALDEHFAAHA